MRLNPYFILVIILTISCSSTKEAEVVIIETKHLFKGCEDDSPNRAEFFSHMKLTNFLNDQFEYPVKAKRENLIGEVVAEYVVDEKGEISEINLLEKLGYGCDEEVVRMLRTLPGFIPATLNGEAIKSKDTLIFKFKGWGDPLSSIYKITEYAPVFDGCPTTTEKISLSQCSREKMNDFIYRNLKYPRIAKRKKIEGAVVISFIVEEDGSVGYPYITSDLEYGCGVEALRIVKLMPRWNPARHSERIVRCIINLPIKFGL